MENGVSTKIFIYGTLINRFVRWVVCGKVLKTRPHRLHGYRRVGVPFHSLTLKIDGDGWVDGLLIEVDASVLRRLTLYERNYTLEEIADGIHIYIRK